LGDHEITLVTQADKSVTTDEVQSLAASVSHLEVFPRSLPAANGGLLGKAWRLGQFFWEGTPPSVRSNHNADMQAWLDDRVKTERFDALTCEHSVNERYVSPWMQARIPKRVVNIHSSVYGTCRQQLQTGTAEKPGRDRLNLLLLRRYETTYCRKFTDLVVTTPEDATQMQELCPDRPVHIVTNGVDLELFPMRSRDPGGHHLVFIGAMDTLANIDTAVFLSRDILPQVRVQYPDTTLTLVGSRPVPEVSALGDIPGVTVTGRVPSMVDYLHQATLCVIPMRVGYGIKNKTLEAMAAGTPVVASDRGLEGLTVDGAAVPLRALRANTVDEYVSAIHRLFAQPDQRSVLSFNARTMIEADFTWTQAGQTYHRIVSD
jgi:glycosyltransferase involved in cell wall biosynthesis